jgi:BMFP domain-containing protein YqiC
MAFKETTMQPVSTQKFEELVASTTSYLQKLMDKSSALEKRIEALEAKKGEKKDG